MKCKLHHRVGIYKQTVTQAADGSPASTEALRTGGSDVRCRLMPISLMKRAVQGRIDHVVTHKVFFDPEITVEPFDRLYQLDTKYWFKVLTVKDSERNKRIHHISCEAVKL